MKGYFDFIPTLTISADVSDAPEIFKTEQPVPEVIEIKEEIAESAVAVSNSGLLSPGLLEFSNLKIRIKRMLSVVPEE